MAGCASIDEPGTYLLTADDEAPGTTCIKITASDVVLDCQNHTLSANHKVDGINVINARNVTVKNCNLNRFRMAFLGQQSEGITFVDNTLRGTYNGIWLESVSGSAFERNSAWGFSSGNAIYANNSHGNYFGRNVLGLAQRSVVLWKSGRNTFYKNSMRNSFNEAAYIYQSDDNRFESNDMDASATRQSRMYTLFVGNSKNNSFKANAMCSPGYGLSCNNATEIGDLGGNSCMVQSGCGISCGNCTLREWYDDPLVPPAIPG
jgi:parallel beta-helix repeat protein